MEQTLLTKPLFGLFTYLGGEFKKKILPLDTTLV